MKNIKIHLSPFKLLLYIAGSAFFAFGFLSAIYHGQFQDNLLINILFICGFLLFFMLLVLFVAMFYKFSHPVIIFDDMGFTAYNKVTKNPKYFIPKELLLGIHYDLKRPTFFSLILKPDESNDEKYRVKLNNIELPQTLKNCPQKVPVVVLDQIVVKLHTEKINFKLFSPLFQKYFNTLN